MASGNVVCSAEVTADELKSMVETLLRERFRYDAWVVVIEAPTLESIIDACPYPADDAQTTSYVTLSSDPAALDELARHASEIPGAEFVRLSPEAIAWPATAGSTLDV